MKETGNKNYIYKNELEKACFQQDMTYGDFKDLSKGTASDKVLRDVLMLQTILNMMDIKEGWLLWFRNFLIKNPLHAVVLLIMRLNKIYN